jgi:hypothetical protein
MDYENKNWPVVFLSLNLVVICLALVGFMNIGYPKVGHDYSYQIPQLLDTALHFRYNGVTIQWYTPTFGGGLPAFPNPNNLQFSFPSALSLLIEPWQAIEFSSVFIVSLGFLACTYFFSRILKLHWTSSLLGAIFFSANGFILERTAVGHLGYQTFPILAIFIISLLSTSVPRPFNVLIFALATALVTQQAGYFVLIIFGLSLLITIPLIYIFQPDLFSWKRFFAVLIMGALIALLISASKLAAVYAFMRFFPRQISDSYPTNPIFGLFGIILQLLGTMNLVPLMWIARLNPILLPGIMVKTTGAMYGYWEFDMSLTPVVFGIILAAANRFFHRPQKYLRKLEKDNKWIAFILLLFSIILCTEFTLANGWIYSNIRNLPILSSMHVNARFAAAFLFPFAMIAAIIHNSWTHKWSKRKSFNVFLLLNLLSLIPLGFYFTLDNDIQGRIYDISQSTSIFNNIRVGDTYDISRIGVTADNTQALKNNTSNLNPYEPIFGYALESFHPEIKAGSIWEASNGYFNMTNPTGYVFPEINASRPFERIRIGDKSKMNAFVKHYQPDWKIPFYQQILDWVSLSTLIVSLFVFGFYSFTMLFSYVGSTVTDVKIRPG